MSLTPPEFSYRPSSFTKSMSLPEKQLKSEVREQMEQHLGQDFSGVRVHTQCEDQQLIDAKAFTTGSDIFFNPEQSLRFPGTQSKSLEPHELTHVTQLRGATDTL